MMKIKHLNLMNKQNHQMETNNKFHLKTLKNFHQSILQLI